MNITRIKAENVFTYKNFELQFDNKIYLVLGKIDDSFERSNGAGKSAIVDIIFWGLYGKTLRGQTDISTNHENNCFVEIEFDNKKIIRGKDLNGNNYVKFFENNREIYGKKKELNGFITEEINFDLFKIVTALTPYNNFFILSDTDKKDLLISLTKNNIIDEIYEKVKEDLDKIKNLNYDMLIIEYKKILEDSEQVIKEFNEVKKQLDEYLIYEEGLIKYNEYMNLKLKLEKDLEEYKIKYNDIKNRGKQVAEQVKNFKEIDLVQLQNDLAMYKQQYKSWEDKIIEVNKKLEQLKDESVCPLCGTELKDKTKIEDNYKNVIIEARQQLKILNDLISTTLEEYEKLKQLKQQQDEVYMLYKELKGQFKAIKETYKNLQQSLLELEKKYEDYIKYKDCKVSLQVIQNIKYKYGELKQKKLLIEETKEKLDKLLKEKEKIEAEKIILEELKKIFSKDGIKQFIIQKIVNFLEQQINKMIVEIYKDIIVKIDLDFTEKRNLMEIYIIRNNKKFYITELSTGERRILEIIFQIALTDLFECMNPNKYINLGFFDETFDALDRENVDKIIVILNLLKSKQKTIFIISHNDLVKKYFENIIIVNKKNNCSILEFN